ncbi:MAG: hypothetical protein NT023_20100 [Armatimonadetes bacterium]|nr:hypothetical protein [Armatimonadota bacterium]
MKHLRLILLVVCLARIGLAQQKPVPDIKYTTLRVITAGTKATFVFCGDRLDFISAKMEKPTITVKLVSIKPSEGDFKRFGSQQVTLEVEAMKECKPDNYSLVLIHKDGVKATTNLAVLDAVEGILPVKRPISESTKAMPLTGSSWLVLDSLAGGNADYFRFEGRAGEKWEMKVLAGRVGSSADVVLRVRNSHRIALAMSAGLQKRDRKLAFTCPKDGAYTLELSDMDLRGGKEFSYGLWGRRLP